jgi:hypothetical protein
LLLCSFLSALPLFPKGLVGVGTKASRREACSQREGLLFALPFAFGWRESLGARWPPPAIEGEILSPTVRFLSQRTASDQRENGRAASEALPLDGLSSPLGKSGLFAKPSSPSLFEQASLLCSNERALKKGLRGPFGAFFERSKGLVGPFSKPLCSNAYEELVGTKQKGLERISPPPLRARGSMAAPGHRGGEILSKEQQRVGFAALPLGREQRESPRPSLAGTESKGPRRPFYKARSLEQRREACSKREGLDGVGTKPALPVFPLVKPKAKGMRGHRGAATPEILSNETRNESEHKRTEERDRQRKRTCEVNPTLLFLFHT